jgi:hypothetical protein
LLICSRWVAMEAEVAADGLEVWLPGGSTAGRAEAVAAVHATIVAVRAMRCEVFMWSSVYRSRSVAVTAA